MRGAIKLLTILMVGFILISDSVLQSAHVGEIVLQSDYKRSPLPHTAGAVERVRSGLQALYDFRFVDGEVVKDRSGAGQPMNLLITQPAPVRQSEEGALEVTGETLIQSEDPPQRIIEAIRWTGEITLEAWIHPANTDQDGPARILTVSRNSGERNVTLGQAGDRYEVRFRTSQTSTNGIPSLTSANQSLTTELTHVVYTRDRLGRARMYLNSEMAAEDIIPGDVSNWSDSYHLAFANELDGARSWQGAYYMAAIYNRALTSREVEQNFLAGVDAIDASPVLAHFVPSAKERLFNAEVAPIIVRHCFECHDASTREGGLDLSQYAAALAGGASGKAIVPGDAEASLLWSLIQQDVMPLARPSLSTREKEIIRTWIDSGAVWTTESIDPALFARQGSDGLWVQRLTAPEYIETVRSALGVDIAEVARSILPPDLRADGFSNTAYNLNIDLAHVEAYATLAEIIVERMNVMDFATQFTDNQEPTEENFRELIAAMGKWVLRGPLKQREIDLYQRIAITILNEGGDFEEAARYILEAMIQSPRFIYRIENQRGDGTLWPLNDYELASRLSYILWGGPPDEELMRAADAGELTDRSAVAEQVQRMVQDPRVVDRSLRFISEWLDMDRLDTLRPPPDRFPHWNEQLAQDMRNETLAFFHDIVWEQNRPLWDLMNAPFTYAAPRLAEHYNLDRSLATAPIPLDPITIPERVVEGLQALYTFQEGEGDTVHDVAGDGEPINLKIGAIITDLSSVQWSEEGLSVLSPTLISSPEAPHRLVDAVRTTGEITLEAWITPENTSQSGPARILTLSPGISNRNFTLGQAGNEYDVRFLTSETDPNGSPSLSTNGGAVKTQPTHVVYTRDANGQAKLYINGKLLSARTVIGDLSHWDRGYQLAIANELSSDRPWLGTMHLAAIYNRALSVEEVRRNYSAGARREGPLALSGKSDLAVLYRFDEGQGRHCNDAANVGDPLHLTIEDDSSIEWNRDGLVVHKPAFIIAESPNRLIKTIRASGEITLDAWITPADASQTGPARIITLSSGTGQRNFTLGQDGDQFEVRFRSTASDANGLPGLRSPSAMAHPQPTHIAFTHNAEGKSILYINGEKAVVRNNGGDMSNWDDGYQFVLANETTKDRPWKGTFHSVVIYSRALTQSEVYSNSQAMLRFDLASDHARGGLLTHGSVLTVGGNEASMVTRGLFILHDFLFSTVGNAPPGVDTTPVPTAPGLSQRRAAEARLTDRSCMGCHSKFEPLAFGLEKFDGLGAYSEVDEYGNELREDGEILFPGEAEPIAYDTSAELMDLLADSERIRMNFTRKITQFALGRPLILEDAPFIEAIHETAMRNGGTYISLIQAIVMSDLVQMTRTESYQSIAFME